MSDEVKIEHPKAHERNGHRKITAIFGEHTASVWLSPEEWSNAGLRKKAYDQIDARVLRKAGGVESEATAA